MADAVAHIVRARATDRLFTVAAWGLAVLGMSLPIAIVAFLAINGLSAIDWSFLVDGPRGLPLGRGGGIGPAITGSFALIVIGLAVALPLGVGGAIYMTEYSTSPRLGRQVRFAAECLAAIPSIVYGLFGYAVLVVFLALKVSLLAGGITLGLVMFPLIFIGSQEALAMVSREYREAGLAMGVTRAHAVRRIVLPKALPGIVAVVTLAAGHAFGSAAPVLYTASVIFSRGELDLAAPVMTLPTHLYYLVGEAVSSRHAYGTALVLVTILFVANMLGMFLRRRMQ